MTPKCGCWGAMVCKLCNPRFIELMQELKALDAAKAAKPESSNG